MARKRKSGTGTIRQRKDGRWEGRAVVGYDDKGLPKTKNVLAKTKRECQEKLAKLLEEVGGTKSEKICADMPFGEWMDFWYQTYLKPGLRPTTQLNYESTIYQHIIPQLGSIPLCQLSQKDLQQFYAYLKKEGRLVRTEQYGKGLSDRMVRMCHAKCRAALDQAVRENLIRSNPAVGCKLPPKRGREMQVLSRQELQRFLIQAKADDYFELFLLDLSTGLRRGELLALQWSDLDLDTGTLSVTKQIYEVKGKLQLSVPKTKTSIRKLVLPPAVVEVFREYRKTAKSRWVFPSPVKEDMPLTPGSMLRRLHIILERAGCKQIRFHDLRHTFATMALENGMDIKTLSQLCWAMYRRRQRWTSTPTSPAICLVKPLPKSTGAWAMKWRRTLLRQIRSLTFSRSCGASVSRELAASPRSTTTSLRGATRQPGRTAPSTLNASTPTPGRSVRRS